MPTNAFFPNLVYEPEQDILQDLFHEAVQVHGMDVYYVPKEYSATRDKLYTEDPRAYFADAFPVAVFLKSAEAFEGDGHFLSKFGLEIRDQIVLSMSRKEFDQEVAPAVDFLRPREGDLIYIPMNDRIFEIRFVQKYSMLYPLGSLPCWDMRCEVLEATSQHFTTDIDEINAFETASSFDELHWAMRNENDDPIRLYGDVYWMSDDYDPEAKETLAQTGQIQTESDNIISFDEVNPFNEGQVF